MQRLPKQVAAVTAALALAVAAASCGSSSSSSSSTPSSGGGAVPPVDVTKFTADFAVMKTLQGLAAQGKGKIGVLLPDTTTSTRYVQYDAPNLTKAFEAAGLSSSDFKITNAQGSVVDDAAAGRSRHHRRRLRAADRSDRHRIRRSHREERRGQGPQGDRL